ncbi:MAG: hypothetical protein GY869_14440 [Planctomycetes bacterium]|nr:hypothetical protein [Planctomycetota bacterium]
MTKSRKIYLGILLLAGGSLILDKTVLQPSVTKPQDTQANEAKSAPPNTPPASNVWAEPTSTPKSPGNFEPKNFPNSNTFVQTPSKVKNVISKLVGAISGNPSPPNLHNENRDLFSASDDFISAISLTPINPPEPNDLSEEKPESLTMTLKITGIVIGPYRNSAYINDEVLFLNQNIGPYTVLGINPDSVVLASKNERLILILDK